LEVFPIFTSEPLLVDSVVDYIYGLGAVLYFLLTAKPPHAGATLKEVLHQARDAPVVAPRRIDRRVPRALERVCMKALATDLGRATGPLTHCGRHCGAAG
jgi:hypothetical protein